MNRKILLLGFIFILSQLGFSQKGDISFDKYHSPQEINQMLKKIMDKNTDICSLHPLAKSAGGIDISILEIGSEIKKEKKKLPAVFIAANMEGALPITSEAALFIINSIIEKPEFIKDKTYYILSCGNPDAAQKFFNKPLYRDPRNASKYNDDMDEEIDEDGYEDLNKDGYITEMRVKDQSGEWIPSENDPMIMRKADWTRGERGIYKIYIEGIDNDNDGKYNEDPPGGVNIGINFPHLFKSFNPVGGSWAGSESESFNLIKFMNGHKEIGLVIVFGSSNYCLNPPKSNRKGDIDLSKIYLPPRYAQMFNVEPSQSFTLQEVLELAKAAFPDFREINESVIANMLGFGAAVNPIPEDLKFYQDLSDKYKEFIKKNKIDEKRIEPESEKDGSLELWTYYQLGLATFALDFWTLPEAKDEKKKDSSALSIEKIENMKDTDFLLLGEEKITNFLKENNVQDFFNYDQINKGIKSGSMNLKKIAEIFKKSAKPKNNEEIDKKQKALISFNRNYLNGKGFIPWTSYQHPQLGEVEIGGTLPYIDSTPPDSMIQKLVSSQAPWVFEIAQKMPRIKILKTEVKNNGSGLYEVKAYIENSGYLPYPTAMGLRANNITPVIAALEGNDYKIIEGKKRTLIKKINGNSIETVKWLIVADKPIKINLKISTMFAYDDETQIQIGGGK